MEPLSIGLLAAGIFAALATASWTALKGWQGWLELKRFELLERRADFAEGRADALGMTGPKSLEEEIAELKAAEKVDAELEAMKAALAAKGK